MDPMIIGGETVLFSGQNIIGLELEDGRAIPVSPLNKARIIYDGVSGFAAVSISGSVYAAMGPASAITGWKRTGTTIAPLTVGDSVNTGTGKLTTPASITLSPLGGGADDWVTFYPALTSASPRAVTAAPALWHATSKQTPWAQFSSVDFSRSTIHYDNRPIVGAFNACAIHHNVQPAATTTTATVPSTDPTARGCLLNTVDGGIPAGSRITIMWAAMGRRAGYEVVSVADQVLGDAQLSAPVTAGATAGNTDANKLYYNVTKPAAVPVIDVYKDAAKTAQVMTGTRADDAGGVIHCTAVGGSGLTMDITIAATVVPDSTADNVITVGGALTLDGPLFLAFPIGSDVVVIPAAQQCRDITITGGTWVPNVAATSLDEMLIELFTPWDVHLRDMVIDGGGITLVGISLDQGGNRSSVERVVFDGKGATWAGLGMFSQRDAKFLRCASSNCSDANFRVASCFGSVVEDCVSDGGINGLRLCYDSGADTQGSIDCRVVRGLYAGAITTGIWVGDGSHGNTLAGPIVRDVASIGVQFTGGTAACYDNNLNDALIERCANGISSDTGALNNAANNCDVNYCPNGLWISAGPFYCSHTRVRHSTHYAIYVAGATLHLRDVDVIDTTDITAAQSAIYAGANGIIRGHDISVSSTGATAIYGVRADAASALVAAHDVTVSVGANGIGLYSSAGGVIQLNNYTQATGGKAIAIDGAGVVKIRGVLRVTGLTGALVTLSGGAVAGQCNCGAFTSNGIAPDVVAIGQITTTSKINLYDAATGDRVMSAYTIIEYTSATWAGGALLAGTYYWQIV